MTTPLIGTAPGVDPEGVVYTRRDAAMLISDAANKADYDRYIWLVRGRRLGWDDATGPGCPFRVADPTMTFILLRANRDLQRLRMRWASRAPK